MFTISEFSRISGLSVKALRIYHENGILVPSVVNSENGYRQYDFNNVERARTISLLREMMFSLEDIRRILSETSDDADALTFLERHRAILDAKIAEMKRVTQSIDTIIQNEKAALAAISHDGYRVEEKEISDLKIAGIRTTGKYADSGRSFAKLGKAYGRQIAGKALNLLYDTEFKEEGADFESCFPVKGGKAVGGISLRDLAGGPALTLVHKGPYGTLGRSYSKLFAHASERGFSVRAPTREIYLKGPGMLFKGNPNSYLTEIQFLETK